MAGKRTLYRFENVNVRNYFFNKYGTHIAVSDLTLAEKDNDFIIKKLDTLDSLTYQIKLTSESSTLN